MDPLISSQNAMERKKKEMGAGYCYTAARIILSAKGYNG
jgi:hypothetical protein